MTAPDTQTDVALAAPIADTLLLAARRHRARRLSIEPASAASHRAIFYRQGRAVASTFLASEVAALVIERYRFIAEIDPGSGQRQTATFATAGGADTSRWFLTTRGAEETARAELWVLDDDAADEPLPHQGEVLSLEPGHSIGPLRIEGKLGAGGMGLVYRAHHVLLDRPCAIKVMRPEVTRDAGTLDAFFREARLAARTSHDGTVSIMDVGTLPDGRPYIVMELIDGDSFEELVEAEGPLEPLRAARLVRDTAVALAVLHDRGIVHCDVTPSNVFVSRDGERERVKLVDFGSARIREEQEESEIVYGTPYYMAPEQIRGQVCDGRTDLYALGAVLHELLTGMPPFEGDSAVEIARNHLNQVPPVPVGPHGPVPPELVRILHKMLSKAAADRYPDGRALAADIDRMLDAPASRPEEPWARAIA